MKSKIISFFVSILFLPCVILGQFVGSLIGKVLYNTWIYQSLNFFKDGHAEPLLASLLGGIFAGLVVSFVALKIKSYNFVFLVFLPCIYALVVIISSLHFSDYLVALDHVIIIVAYVITIKNIRSV